MKTMVIGFGLMFAVVTAGPLLGQAMLAMHAIAQALGH
jgi:hypothetical protein